MAYSIKYTEQVNQLAERCQTTINKTLMVLRALSEVLGETISLGNGIDCEIFTIEYVISKKAEKGRIYQNTIIGREEQVEGICNKTGYEELEVARILWEYYKMCFQYLELGYQVNIKGIGYVEPVKGDMGYRYTYRISPSLVKKKTKKADYMVLSEDGSLKLTEIPQENLRFNMTLTSKLVEPIEVKDSYVKKI